jgi:hypothetical protein
MPCTERGDLRFGKLHVSTGGSDEVMEEE